MPKVKIIARRNILTRLFFRVEEVKLQHELNNGAMSQVITRLCLHRGNAVAMLIHDTQSDSLLFTDQFRYPTYDNGQGWLVEIPAGIIERGEDAVTTARRELLEEIGYDVPLERFQHIAKFYTSPGGSSELIDLYYVAISATDKKTEGGGVPEEGEHVHALKLPIHQVQQKLQAGEFMDAKTLVGLHWFFAQRK